MSHTVSYAPGTRALDVLLSMIAVAQIGAVATELVHPGIFTEWLGASQWNTEALRRHGNGPLRAGYLDALLLLVMTCGMVLTLRLLLNARRLKTLKFRVHEYSKQHGITAPVTGLIEIDARLFGGYFLLSCRYGRWLLAKKSTAVEMSTGHVLRTILTHQRARLIGVVFLACAFGGVWLWGNGDAIGRKFVLVHAAYAILVVYVYGWLCLLALFGATKKEWFP